MVAKLLRKRNGYLRNLGDENMPRKQSSKQGSNGSNKDGESNWIKEAAKHPLWLHFIDYMNTLETKSPFERCWLAFSEGVEYGGVKATKAVLEAAGQVVNPDEVSEIEAAIRKAITGKSRRARR
jgi:hypothetical protein